MEKLTAEGARVLGCLVEKQMTTPEYYPMTVNALVTASNQKTSRHPVVTYDDEIVERALADLTDRGLVRFTRTPGARALKYVHKAGDVLQIDDHQLALVAVLLLRGPQTPGELRTRTDRYVRFRDVPAVEEVLDDLMTRDEPLVERLERIPGQKESRYRTLLTEPVAAEIPSMGAGAGTGGGEARTAGLEERIDQLEERLARIESELGLT